ncbi:MAG: ribosome maturation factor RimM [Mobilicoccus sp.]|nr:ribosome maturation factor RimM [Mobilicoccus sp.]
MNTVVARIGKPHGLRGEVTVQLHTDTPEQRFTVGETFATEPDRGTLTLSSARVHQGIWLLGFEEAGDRTAAEALRNTRLLAEEAEEDDDAWYEVDLVGVAVFDPAGERIGEVTALHVRPAQDLLEVRRLDGRVGLVPFVAEIVTDVVEDDGGVTRMVMDVPPGLFDLD